MNRIDIVTNALGVSVDDAEKVIAHLTNHGCIGWIDNYSEENRSDEPLVDVHYENTFESMIDWKFEGEKPSEILGRANRIEDYPEMLGLDDGVIFWYGLV